jgi:7-keto-8-aminopelargonate synthetase-like enzyme
MASCGGYIAGSKVLCDYLRATAPGFVFSVGLSPVLAASALESCKILLSGEGNRVTRLQENGRAFRQAAQAAGLDTGPSAGLSVIPIIVGDSVGAVTLSNRLHERGILALPIIFPAVGEKSARLRFFVTSEHTTEQIERAVAVTAEEFAALKSGNGGFRALVDRISQRQQE